MMGSISLADAGDGLIWIIRDATRYLPITIASVTLLPVLSALKSFLHWYTGRDEISRVAGRRFRTDADRLYSMKCALAESKSLKGLFRIDVMTEVSTVSEAICETKKITDLKTHVVVNECLLALQGIVVLSDHLENLRRTAFNEANPQHESLLRKLWIGLRPNDVHPGSVSNHWDQIGFQGKNPASDFRGNGILGLQNLVDFCERYNDLARSICDSYREDPIKFPGFAICGICITSDAVEMVKSGNCDRYLLAKGGASMDTFVDLYAMLWQIFDRLWKEKQPPDVMSFSAIHETFKQELQKIFASKNDAIPRLV